MMFGKIALRVPGYEKLSMGDQHELMMYHEITASHPLIEDLKALINSNVTGWIAKESRSYIDITIGSNNCSGTVNQRYCTPDSVMSHSLIGVKGMELQPNTISFVLKTIRTSDKNRMGWAVTRDYAFSHELTGEGQFTSENSFSVAQVGIPGILMKEISIDDPDFPVAPGINIGGGIDVGHEIDFH